MGAMLVGVVTTLQHFNEALKCKTLGALIICIIIMLTTKFALQGSEASTI